MKKPLILALVVLVGVVVILSFSFSTQSIFGAEQAVNEENLKIGESEFSFFGSNITAIVKQGVKTDTFYKEVKASCTLQCPGSSRYVKLYNYCQRYDNRILGAPTEVCTYSGGQQDYIDPFYCSYNITIDGISTTGNTFSDFKREIVKDDLKVELGGSSSGGWNTVLESSWYDPETGIKQDKNLCTGFTAKFAISIRKDLMDLRLDNNSIIFENNWRDLEGSLCVARNQSKVKQCFAIPLKKGVSKVEFALPTETDQLMPLLDGVSIEGSPIGGFQGSWAVYEVKKEALNIEQPVNVDVQEVTPQIAREFRSRNFIEKIWAWLMKLI